PWPAFEWAEALRASALRLAPVTPPRDPELRGALVELRQVSAEIVRAEHGARPTRPLLARQARVETRIRRLSRHAPGGELPSRAAPRRVELAAALGNRALVEYVESGGELTALTLAGRRLDRRELGPLAAVEEQLEWLRFAIARLAHLKRDAPQRAALVAGARSAAEAIDAALLRPVRAEIGERELVLVPTGALRRL